MYASVIRNETAVRTTKFFFSCGWQLFPVCDQIASSFIQQQFEKNISYVLLNFSNFYNLCMECSSNVEHCQLWMVDRDYFLSCYSGPQNIFTFTLSSVRKMHLWRKQVVNFCSQGISLSEKSLNFIVILSFLWPINHWGMSNLREIKKKEKKRVTENSCGLVFCYLQGIQRIFLGISLWYKIWGTLSCFHCSWWIFQSQLNLTNL